MTRMSAHHLSTQSLRDCIFSPESGLRCWVIRQETIVHICVRPNATGNLMIGVVDTKYYMYVAYCCDSYIVLILDIVRWYRDQPQARTSRLIPTCSPNEMSRLAGDIDTSPQESGFAPG